MHRQVRTQLDGLQQRGFFYTLRQRGGDQLPYGARIEGSETGLHGHLHQAEVFQRRGWFGVLGWFGVFMRMKGSAR